MTKVQVTKNEYDYLETFESKNKALFYISRYGWSFDLKDGQGETYDDKRKKWSDILGIRVSDKVRYKLIRAVLDGYELKEQLYYVNIPNVYHGDFGYNKFSGKYSFYNKENASAVRFELTEEEIKEKHDWAWQFAKPVDEE